MIITDSLSSLQALKSQKLNNPIVSNILQQRLPWIRQNSFIIYNILISSLSTLMTFCKVNGTSMSPANCSRYNQSLSDLLHQWNAEEMTLSYAGPELAMPISQTGIY